MKPQSKLWKLIPQQSHGVLDPPPSAGLFNLQISMHCVFVPKFGMSFTNKIQSI